MSVQAPRVTVPNAQRGRGDSVPEPMIWSVSFWMLICCGGVPAFGSFHWVISDHSGLGGKSAGK